MADLYKFDTWCRWPSRWRRPSRPAVPSGRCGWCRDIFRQTRLLDRIIPDIEEMLAAGKIPRPAAPADAVGPALPNRENLGDAGHRA